MRILVLDAALDRAGAAVIVDGAPVAVREVKAVHGQAQALAPMAEAVLETSGVPAIALELVAVTVGPGSFTGLRAAVSVALGVGLATGRPVVGVTVAEALAEALPLLGGRALWTAIDSRRGRIFLDHGGLLTAAELDALPEPAGAVAVAGDAAIAVAARLAARGSDIMLTDARRPQPRHVAAVAARRHAGLLPPLPARPLYVDAPEARPARGSRPPPRMTGMPDVATPAHAGLLANIHAQSFPAGEAWSAEAFAVQLAQPGTLGLIDSRGGFVLARIAADESEILTLAVLPDCRRRGIARCLLRAASGAMWARGARTLFLEVSETNGAARALYAATGFTAVGRRQHYYAGGGNALVLQLNLGHDAAGGC